MVLGLRFRSAFRDVFVIVTEGGRPVGPSVNSPPSYFSSFVRIVVFLNKFVSVSFELKSLVSEGERKIRTLFIVTVTGKIF